MLSLLWACPWERQTCTQSSLEHRWNLFSSVHVSVLRCLMFPGIMQLSLAMWPSQFQLFQWPPWKPVVASRWLLMVCLDILPVTPWRSALICRGGLWQCLLQCCMVSLSSLSVVTLGRPLVGRSLMFPVCLFLATRRLTSPYSRKKTALSVQLLLSATSSHHSFFLLPHLTCLESNSKQVTVTRYFPKWTLASPWALCTRVFALEYCELLLRAQPSAQVINMN